MADKKISELDIAAAVTDDSAFAIVQGQTTKQVSGEQIKDYVSESSTPVYGMGKNLLDNWYFLNPVNQRGGTTYSGAVKMIDRWYGEVGYSQLQVTGNGVKVYTSGSGHSGIVTQNVNGASTLLGATVNLSAIIDGELISDSATIPSSFQNATIINLSSIQLYMTSSGYLVVRMMSSSTSGIIVKAVKLELGTQQTLAHQENGVWVINEIPDYEEELVKCQTSTADPSDTVANKKIANEQELAYVESGFKATRNYVAGEYVCLVGILYQVTTAIASGTNFNSGSGGNCRTIYNGGLNEQLKVLKLEVTTSQIGTSFSPTTRDMGSCYSWFGIDASRIVGFAFRDCTLTPGSILLGGIWGDNWYLASNQNTTLSDYKKIILMVLYI